MRNVIGLLALIVLTTGCGAMPRPKFDLYAPYGPPRVEPPATGSYGSPNTYYPQTNSPTSLGAANTAPVDAPVSSEIKTVAYEGDRVATADSQPTGKLRWRPTGTRLSTTDSTQEGEEAAPSETAQVALASFTKPAADGDVIRVVERAAPEQSKLELKGMPINDFSDSAIGRIPSGPTTASIEPVSIEPVTTDAAPVGVPRTLPPEISSTPVRSITVSAPPTTSAETSIEFSQLPKPSPRLRLRGLTPGASTSPENASDESDAPTPEPAEPPTASSGAAGRLIPARIALPPRSSLRENDGLAARLERQPVSFPEGSSRAASGFDWKSRYTPDDS